MKITIVERKLRIGEELRGYAEKKVEKLDRYFTQDADAVVTFRQVKDDQIIEITVKQGAMLVRAEQTTSDFFASLDGAVGNIERQIRKHKTRLERRLREGAFEKAETQAAELAEPFEVVRRKRFTMTPMSVDEAILQMSLLSHTFFFFRNADDDDAPAVLYLRGDGGYGLIVCE